jgi:hypothetical protein
MIVAELDIDTSTTLNKNENGQCQVKPELIPLIVAFF